MCSSTVRSCFLTFATTSSTNCFTCVEKQFPKHLRSLGWCSSVLSGYWILWTVRPLPQGKVDGIGLKADIFAYYLECDTSLWTQFRPSSRSCSLSPRLVARLWQRMRSWSGCRGSMTVIFSCTSELQGEPRETQGYEICPTSLRKSLTSEVKDLVP